MFDQLQERLEAALERIRGKQPPPAAGPASGRIIRNVMDASFLRDQLDTIRAQAAAQPGANRLAPAAYDAAYEELNAATAPGAPRVPFMPRTATNSILQSALTECIESRAGQLLTAAPDGVGRLAHAVLSDVEIFRRFGPCDPLWIETKLAEGVAMFGRRPAFPDSPAPTVPLADDARVVIVGDWGTGLPGAVQVATEIGKWIEAGRGREQHVIHLGDVYYSGWREEYESRFLRHWPVGADEREVLCWSLNGNHDMYSGGHGYFGFLLHDPRFRGHWRGDPDNQTPSSYFSLENDHWQILGLDSGYLDHDLAGAQQQWLADKLRAGRRTMLLSHHQPFSAYESSVSQSMTNKVRAAVPADRPLDAWIWGHEHRCTVYANRPVPWLQFGSCIGHGGVPQVLPDPPLPGPAAPDDPGYAPLTWAYSGSAPADGNEWLRFGFAVLDFSGASVSIAYLDEDNVQAHRVTLP